VELVVDVHLEIPEEFAGIWPRTPRGWLALRSKRSQPTACGPES
jgi:hypothetical protein